MILIDLKGGLGNQMFQYAISHILSKKNNAPVFLEHSFFNLKEKKPGFTPRNFELHIFNNSYIKCSSSQIKKFTKLSYLNKLKKKSGFNYPKIYIEDKFAFNSEVLNTKPPVYLKGYFQSYRYYIGQEKLIKDIFKFPLVEIDEINLKMLSRIKATNSVSVHIRRGDFINDEKTKSFHGNCSLDYYLEAIELMASKIKDIQLVLFSDDNEWVKKNFENLPYPKLFVDYNKDENNWKDMFLMSCCNHNIIANSSFSWWGAWLNNNPHKIVIAPKNWFATGTEIKDLIPEQWIQL